MIFGAVNTLYYSVSWGSGKNFVIVCVVAVITGLLQCVLGKGLLVCYCVLCGSVYWFGILCDGAGITGSLLCVGGSDYWFDTVCVG